MNTGDPGGIKARGAAMGDEGTSGGATIEAREARTSQVGYATGEVTVCSRVLCHSPFASSV